MKEFICFVDKSESFSSNIQIYLIKADDVEEAKVKMLKDYYEEQFEELIKEYNSVEKFWKSFADSDGFIKIEEVIRDDKVDVDLIYSYND